MNSDTMLASGYLLHGTLLRDFDIAMLIDLLGTDGYRYFPEPDRRAMEYLWLHNGCIDDLVAFRTYIGEAGNARITLLQRDTPDMVMSEANAVAWCALLQSEAQRQAGLHLLDTFKARLKTGDPHELLTSLSNEARHIASDSNSGELVTNYEAGSGARAMLRDILSGGSHSYVRTGFEFIDLNWGGFERGKIAGVGGIFASGKTSFMGQVSYYAAACEQKVLWIQNEMTAQDMLFRQAIQQTKITRKRMINQQISEADIQRFNDMTYEIEQLPMRYLYKPGMNSNQLLALMQTAEQSMNGLDMVIIDHIGTLNANDKRVSPDGAKFLTHIYQDLKTVVMPQFPKTALVCLQHLNTNLFRMAADNLQPSQSDFSYQTGGVFNQALIVLRPMQHGRQLKDYSENVLLSLSAEERAKRERDAYLHVVKNRDGASEISQKFSYDGRYYLWTQV